MLLPTIDELSSTPEELQKRYAQLKCAQQWCRATLAEVYRALYSMPLPDVRALVREQSQQRASEIDLFYFLPKHTIFNVIMELDDPAETPTELQLKFDKVMYYRSIFQAQMDQMRLELNSLEQILNPSKALEQP